MPGEARRSIEHGSGSVNWTRHPAREGGADMVRPPAAGLKLAALLYGLYVIH